MNVSPKIIKMAEVLSALELDLTDGVIVVKSDISLQEIINLHHSVEPKDEDKLLDYVRKGMVRTIFGKKDFVGEIPEEVKGIKHKRLYFIQMKWNLV